MSGQIFMGSLPIAAGFIVFSGLFIFLVCGRQRPRRAKAQVQPNPDAEGPPRGAVPQSQAAHSQAAMEGDEMVRRHRKQCLECWSLGIEIAAFIGLTGYAYFSFEMWQEMKRQTVSTNRAWIGATGIVDPQDMDPQHPLQVGKPIYVDLRYQNFGHEPAQNVAIAAKADSYPVATFPPVPADLHFPLIDCAKMTQVGRETETVFPNTTHDSKGPFEDSTGQAAARVVDKAGVFYVNYCFVYTTFSRPHHTSACFYLHMSATTHAPRWSMCTSGNWAD
jgi:hypothetical protein